MEKRFFIEMVDRTLRDIIDSTSFLLSIYNCRMESMEVILRENLVEIKGVLEVMK